MAVNRYFDNWSHPGEQDLLHQLTAEMIAQAGVDIYYIPRAHVNIDEIFGEDVLSKFLSATPIEAWIKNFMSWGGDGDLMSRFGQWTMADQITFCVAIRRWEEEFYNINPEMTRPKEGDLVYLPKTNAVFEIKFVEHEAIFYQSGTLTHYEIKCERFNYSSETVNTGMSEIDNMFGNFSQAEEDNAITDSANNALTSSDGTVLIPSDFTPQKKDPTAENDSLTDEVRDILDFTEENPFGEIEGEE